MSYRESSHERLCQIVEEQERQIAELTRERDAEQDLVKGLVNRIGEIYQIADGPSRGVEGNEVEAVRELRRELDEAKAVLEQIRQSFVDYAAEKARKPGP